MGKVDMDGYIMILLYIFKFNAPLMDVMSTIAIHLKHHFTVGDQWKSESVYNIKHLDREKL